MIITTKDYSPDTIKPGETYRADSGRFLGNHMFREVRASYIRKRGRHYHVGLVGLPTRQNSRSKTKPIRFEVPVWKFNAWREPYIERNYLCQKCGETVRRISDKERMKSICEKTGTETWLILR